MMTRREFIRNLALIAAGATALPEQIDALEQFYERNAPAGLTTLLAVDSIFIGGIAPISTPLIFDLMLGNQMKLRFPWNAFGGVMQWSAMPDQRILAAPGDLRWNVRGPMYKYENHVSPEYIEGYIGFIDPNGIRQSLPLTMSGEVR